MCNRVNRTGKDLQKLACRLVIAFIVSLLLVGLFEVTIHYYFRWSWLLNHQYGLSLEVGFDILIICVVFGLIISQWRKWFIIVVPLSIMLISLIGPRPPEIGVEIVNPLDRSPITVDEIFRIIKLKEVELTGIQKSDLLNKHDGKIVEWTGYVDSVDEPNDKGIPLTFRPESQMGESSPDLVGASFPQSMKVYLVDVSKGDWVVVQGRLRIYGINNVKLVKLDDCKMTRWHHMPRKANEYK